MESNARSISQEAAIRARPLVEELLAAAESRDRARFDALYDLWVAVVFSECARSLGDREAAEGLTEKLLVNAIRAASQSAFSNFP
jgi:DNA-directed RNA polymerase specialized sigma24 family protein